MKEYVSVLCLIMIEHIHHPHISFRITNDAREDEMEDNMQQVGSVLGNLKNMAADMGQEIDRQNKQLDKVGAKVKHRLNILHSFILNFLYRPSMLTTKLVTPIREQRTS